MSIESSRFYHYPSVPRPMPFFCGNRLTNCLALFPNEHSCIRIGTQQETRYIGLEACEHTINQNRKDRSIGRRNEYSI